MIGMQDEARYALGVAADWTDEGLAPATEGEIAVLAMSIVTARNPELFAAATTDDEVDDIDQAITSLVLDVLGLEVDMSWYFDGVANEPTD